MEFYCCLASSTIRNSADYGQILCNCCPIILSPYMGHIHIAIVATCCMLSSSSSPYQYSSNFWYSRPPRNFSLLQISRTRCTILLNIFISLLYIFRASMCPSSGENYYSHATLVFVTLYGWRLVCRTDATHTE